MLKIGLTGGIGSGKTTIAKIFEALGVPVYSADEAAKRLLHTDPLLRASVIQAFGAEAYKAGVFDRAYMSRLVFNDTAKLDLLNQLVHPYTLLDFEHWLASVSSYPCVLKEAALLFETRAFHHLDFVIGVFCEREERISRVLLRDGRSRDEVDQIIQRQLSESLKMKLCDVVIDNNKHTRVLPQVLNIYHSLPLNLKKAFV